MPIAASISLTASRPISTPAVSSATRTSYSTLRITARCPMMFTRDPHKCDRKPRGFSDLIPRPALRSATAPPSMLGRHTICAPHTSNAHKTKSPNLVRRKLPSPRGTRLQAGSHPCGHSVPDLVPRPSRRRAPLGAGRGQGSVDNVSSGTFVKGAGMGNVRPNI
jgi:hypothetical protein